MTFHPICYTIFITMAHHNPIHTQLTEILDNAHMRPIHWRIWFLSAMGIFLDGFDLFIIGVAMPLISLTFKTTPHVVGLIGSAALIGAVFGAMIGGFLTDRFGRKLLYVFDIFVVVILCAFSAFSWSSLSLIVFRFLLGIGIGADYPICATYISAFMPKRLRGRMLIGAFSFQALGMFAAALVGLVILKIYPSEQAWRFMLGFATIPAVIIMLLRFTVPESARWCLEKGRHTQAAHIIGKMVPHKRDEIHALAAEAHRFYADIKTKEHQLASLFKPRYIRNTVLSSVPWFLMDIATYGIGIFTPIILGAMAFSGHGLNTIASDFKATEGAAFLDIFLALGFLLNILLIEKWGRIKLQLFGFGGMAIGLLVLAVSSILPAGHALSMFLLFSGFTIFNLLMNMGPNATTFILPAELYPTKMRATGHGFAAAIGKIGAAVGIFLLPVTKAHFGLTFTLIMLAIFCVLAFMVTLVLRVETKGKSLEELGMIV
jgi:MFS family permease